MGSPFKMSGELISVEGAAPNGMRIRQLSDKLCQLQDELDTEKEVRGEAVELKLKVLDDKLIRAQITEEEKIKPLHDHVNSLTEERHEKDVADEIIRIADSIDAERKNRLDGEEAVLRKLNDEMHRLQDLVATEQGARRDLELKVMK